MCTGINQHQATMQQNVDTNIVELYTGTNLSTNGNIGQGKNASQNTPVFIYTCAYSSIYT